MEKIAPGKYVEMGYDLFVVTPEGEEILVHQTNADDPEKIVFGVTPGMIQPLEKAIEGLQKGDKFDVKVSSDDAFGPHDPEQVAKLEKEIFMVDGKFDDEYIAPGAVVPMMMADGYRINGIVVSVGPDYVEMDFNHPLAGKDVQFRGEIFTVRDATDDELHPACGCGCGSQGCGCGDSCDCGDEKSCGCDCGK